MTGQAMVGSLFQRLAIYACVCFCSHTGLAFIIVVVM